MARFSPRSETVAWLSLFILGVSTSLAHASDYGRDVGGNFDDPVWTRDTPLDADYAKNVGPPGSGDTGTMTGSGAVTAAGGDVKALGSNVDFIVNGAFHAGTYHSTATLQGGGVLTVDTLDTLTNVQGGNLAAAASTHDGVVVLKGGTLDAQTYQGYSLGADQGSKVTIHNGVTDLNATVAGGSSVTVASITNGRDEGLKVKDAGSAANVSGAFSITAGTLDLSGGGTLKVDGDLTLDGGKDADGNNIGGGGAGRGAGTFISVGGNFLVGVTAPSPGFSMTLDSGAVLSTNLAQIARDNGSRGVMTMSGAGTVWNVGQGVAVGSAGNGELDMDTGAQLQCGSGAQFLVGASAGSRGKLQADGVGTIIDARQAVTVLGKAAGAQGSVTLDNGASLLLGQDTFVGGFGGGGLSINGGSQTSIGTDTGTRNIRFGVGDSAGGSGSVSVNGAGSQFYMGDYVLTIIGVDGNGFFGVGNGGTVRTSALKLAGTAAATGKIVLDGSGTTWTNTDATQVGGSPTSPGGSGAITLTNGAQMRAAANPRAECFLSATGQIVLDAASEFAVGSGAFGPPGTLRVTGVLSGKGRQAGSTVYNTNVTGKVIVGAGGKFRPGGDPDVFSVQGDCDLSDGGAGGGETEIEIGGAGTAGVDYDQLVVSGNVTLGGTLNLVLLPGYVPKVGDRFNFVQAGSISGSFAQIVAPGLTLSPVVGPGGLSVTVTDVALTAPPAVTSAATATAYLGQPFSYQIAATNSPSGYAAAGLPDGLSLDAASGLISGVPKVAGVSNVVISATNVGGTGTATLVLTVSDLGLTGTPVITSAASAVGQVGAAFVYQVAASGAPTGFAAAGLPTGLSINMTTGVISGTPTVAGVFAVNLSAMNASGTGTAILTLTVVDAAVQVPTVVVAVAGGGMAVEGGGNAKVAVRRTGDTSAALVVRYKVSGSAKSGVDYKPLSGTLTIPAGAAQAKLKIKPLNDKTHEGTRVAKIKLKAATDGSYRLGSPAVAKVKIIDNE